MTNIIERDSQLPLIENNISHLDSFLTFQNFTTNIVYSFGKKLKIIRGATMKKENSYIYPNFPKELIKSQLHLNRYIKFINSRPIREKIKFKTAYHHKVPKSLGGSNNKDNMIYLSHREHFIAHLILWKAFEEKMQSAMWLMANTNKRLTSKQYSILKQSNAKHISNHRQGIVFSDETKQKMSNSADHRGDKNPMYGKHHSEQTKKKIAEKNKNKKLSEEHKEKLRLANYKRVKTVEEKQKISEANKGRKASKKTIESIRKRRKNSIWIFKNEKELSIQKENLEQYIYEGWEKGRFSHSKKMKGHETSEATKERIRQANIGKKRSNETCKKISDSKKGVKPSEETKQKLSKILKDRAQSMTSKERKELYGSSSRGKIGINKDGKIKRILLEDLDSYLEQGYSRGYPKKEKKK